ncbi:hypothetical protein H9P43_009445 [Blastocladiella emersonii ATCC 22665]|nr:hypothetical protein H9P43_009445 [Blastocladiella emersonii ATCC 22665]
MQMSTSTSPLAATSSRQRTTAAASASPKADGSEAALLDNEAAVLDEQEQEELIAKFLRDNAAVDRAFKVAMLAMTLPLFVLSLAQLWQYSHGVTGIPILSFHTAVTHPFPGLGFGTTVVGFLGLGLLLAHDLAVSRADPSADSVPAVQARAGRIAAWLFLSGLVALVVFLAGLFAPADGVTQTGWERVFWAIPVLVHGGFLYSVQEMKAVVASVVGLEELKFKLKGA